MTNIIKKTVAETTDRQEPISPKTYKAYYLLQRKLNRQINIASKRLEQVANLNRLNMNTSGYRDATSSKF